jgi:hypothetical protein
VAAAVPAICAALAVAIETWPTSFNVALPPPFFVPMDLEIFAATFVAAGFPKAATDTAVVFLTTFPTAFAARFTFFQRPTAAPFQNSFEYRLTLIPDFTGVFAVHGRACFTIEGF